MGMRIDATDGEIWQYIQPLVKNTTKEKKVFVCNDDKYPEGHCAMFVESEITQTDITIGFEQWYDIHEGELVCLGFPEFSFVDKAQLQELYNIIAERIVKKPKPSKD
jgi:hypothetical protein